MCRYANTLSVQKTYLRFLRDHLSVRKIWLLKICRHCIMENAQFTHAPKRTTPLDKLQAYIIKLEDKVIALTEENRDLKVELKALRKNKK